MRRRFVITALCMCTLISSLAQEKAFENTPLEDIERGWKTKPLDNVINGSLGIMLERFDQTWPTWMVGEVRSAMEKGLSRVVLDEETSLTVTVDSQNGYVEVSDGGTDGEYMSACVWNRSNGHRLLAVCLGKPTDPFIDFVCFYDYDAARKCLTPEPEILKGYRWGDRKEYTQMFCKLPRKGKNVVVEEWGKEGLMQHTFIWDGMKPVLSKTEPIAEMPKTAVRQPDAHFQHAVYVNVDRPSANEGEIEAVCSVWLADERTGTVIKVCVTNPMAELQWERMKGRDADAVDVPITQIAAADRAYLVPGDVSKVIVEGCPDNRNIWTYIIDPYTQTAKQLPSTEGVVSLDWEKKEIIAASYGYDDDGRYSVKKAYSVDGKFLRRVGEKERE